MQKDHLQTHAHALAHTYTILWDKPQIDAGQKNLMSTETNHMVALSFFFSFQIYQVEHIFMFFIVTRMFPVHIFDVTKYHATSLLYQEIFSSSKLYIIVVRSKFMEISNPEEWTEQI